MLYNILKNETEDIILYVDMDGVIVDFGEVNTDLAQVKDSGFFTNRRPVRTIINELQKVNTLPNVTIEILSITRTEEQILEKNEWLNKYCSFITKRNIFARLTYNLESSHILKEEFIESNLPKKGKVYLIDDDHQVLRHVKNKLNDKVEVLHISSIIE